MKEDIAALAAEVEKLRKLLELHEKRITALEKKSRPKIAEEMPDTAAEMLLADLDDIPTFDGLLPELDGDG